MFFKMPLGLIYLYFFRLPKRTTTCNLPQLTCRNALLAGFNVSLLENVVKLFKLAADAYNKNRVFGKKKSETQNPRYENRFNSSNCSEIDASTLHTFTEDHQERHYQ